TRVLRSLRRSPDGSAAPIDTDQAVTELGLHLAELLRAHGPRSLAMYAGNGVLAHSAGTSLGQRLLRSIGSPMWFSSASIDQPGKARAAELHGTWGAGMPGFDDSDLWMMIGLNPLVSLWAGMGMA